MNTTLKTNQTEETSEQLVLMKSPKQIYSSEDFHVQLFQLLEEEQDSPQMIHAAHSFLKSAESSLVKESHMYSLKMLRDSSITTEEEPLELSSQVWMNLGMTSNGSVLTARISESHRAEKGYLLSDILEEDPDQKYFLSESVAQKIAFKTEKNKLLNRGFGAKIVSPLEHSVIDFTKETLTTSTLTQEQEERLASLRVERVETVTQMDMFAQS